jgi:hypothetical protein
VIVRDKNPVGWATLMYELDDAHEHLGDLLKEMTDSADFTEAEFRIQLGHVYAHLNRAWFGRNMDEGFGEQERARASAFPTDLDPIG